MDPNGIGDRSLQPSLQEQAELSIPNLSDVIEVIKDDIEMNPTAGNLPQTQNGFTDRQMGHPAPQQQPTSQSTHAPSESSRIQQTAYVKIIEQPASKALRFRYECEGRSAGSIPGVNSTPEHKTFPTIEIVGYKGRAVVVVSCVTKDAENGKYKPHPHNLVGKEGCKKGVCTLEVNVESMKVVFSNLGIQCVKKKDIESALKAREEIRVDPFITGYSHKNQPSSIDLNAVRLCFQVFVKSSTGKLNTPLKPVVSDPIYDKKAMSDLVISALCSCSSTVDGGKDIILLCEKVVKEDIEIRFFEEKTGWEAKGEFQHTDVHKQTAIKFRTPRYRTLDIDAPVQVSIQLRRPTDGVTSEPLQFDYLPLDSGKRSFWMMRRHLKRKPDLDLFQRILSEDSEAQKNALIEQENEDSIVETPSSAEDYQIFVPPLKHSRSEDHEEDSYEEEIRIKEREVDKIVQEKMLEFERACNGESVEVEVDTNDADTQTTASLLQKQVVSDDISDLEKCELRPLEPNDKITEWMKSSEFEKTNATLSDGDPTASTSVSGRDNTLNDLLDQVAELDEIYTDHILKRNTDANELAQASSKVNKIDSVDFDDAATYTSLQFAFKNPLPMSDIMPPTPPGSNSAPEDAAYDPIEITNNAQTPVIEVSGVEKSEPLPPLPPKRVKKQQQMLPSPTHTDLNSNSNSSSMHNLSRPQSQIIIMKTPNQSPPSKKLPPTPSKSTSTNSLPRPKKQGFFSKLFSRKKNDTLKRKRQKINDTVQGLYSRYQNEPPHDGMMQHGNIIKVEPAEQIPQMGGYHMGYRIQQVNSPSPQPSPNNVYQTPPYGYDRISPEIGSIYNGTPPPPQPTQNQQFLGPPSMSIGYSFSNNLNPSFPLMPGASNDWMNGNDSYNNLLQFNNLNLATNTHQQQQQQQMQQHQQTQQQQTHSQTQNITDSNLNIVGDSEAPTASGLMDIDSGQLLNLNSTEISNFSSLT